MMVDKYGNKIKVGATLKVVSGRTIHIGETAIVQKICTDCEPHYLVGSFVDKEPVLQIGMGKQPVIDMELRFPMRLYPWEIEIQEDRNGSTAI